MNWKMLCAVLALVFVVEVAVTGQDQSKSVGAPAASDQQKLIARGKYITEDASMCIICHSPKDEAGKVIESKKFEGSSIPVKNPFPKGARWAVNAPSLRTLVHNREDAVFTLLTTGIWSPSGEAPLSPMPPFRLSDDDAQAVIAYLKSL